MRISKIILFAILFFLFPPLIQAEVIDRIVALVNNEVITLSELEEFGSRLFRQLKESTWPAAGEEKLKKARREALEQLIENKLLEQEIRKRKVEVSEREVDAAVAEILKHNRLTENELKMALAKEGITYTSYRRQIRDDLGKMRLINREIKAKIVVHEEDLKKIYQERIKDFTDPVEVKLQQIFLPFPRGATAEEIKNIEEKVAELWRRAHQGEDFAQLARNYSLGPEAKEGGVLGYFKKQELIPELEEVAFKLEEGQISEVIRSPHGFHILRLLERKGGTPQPFAEVAPKIREAKLQEEAEKKFQDWLQNLKSKAYIEIRL